MAYVLCITQNIPNELYSNVAPIILERNPCTLRANHPEFRNIICKFEDINIYENLYLTVKIKFLQLPNFFSLITNFLRPIVLKKPSSWLAVKFYASIDGK
jgi:hypothetical protein